MISHTYVKEFDLGYCQMRLRDDGVVVKEYQKDFSVELEHVLEMQSVMEKIHAESGMKHPVCAIYPRDVTLSKEAREYGTTDEANEYTTAVAAVVTSLAQKMIGNFIMRVQKPPIPLKLFSEREEALKWVAQFCE